MIIEYAINEMNNISITQLLKIYNLFQLNHKFIRIKKLQQS